MDPKATVHSVSKLLNKVRDINENTKSIYNRSKDIEMAVKKSDLGKNVEEKAIVKSVLGNISAETTESTTHCDSLTSKINALKLRTDAEFRKNCIELQVSKELLNRYSAEDAVDPIGPLNKGQGEQARKAKREILQTLQKLDYRNSTTRLLSTDQGGIRGKDPPWTVVDPKMHTMRHRRKEASDSDRNTTQKGSQSDVNIPRKKNDRQIGRPKLIDNSLKYGTNFLKKKNVPPANVPSATKLSSPKTVKQNDVTTHDKTIPVENGQNKIKIASEFRTNLKGSKVKMAENVTSKSAFHLVKELRGKSTNSTRGEVNCKGSQSKIAENVKSKSAFHLVKELEGKTNISGAVDVTVGADKVLMEKRDNTNVERDGLYFIKLLKKEQDRLLSAASRIEDDILALQGSKTPPSEEVFGYLRTAVGKARLLAKQKMRQFEELCELNVKEQPGRPFPTTCADLLGFWDMLRIQIGNVDLLVAEVDEIRKNNWQKVAPKRELVSKPPSQTKVKITRAKPIFKAASSSSTDHPTEASRIRDEQRKLLHEMKQKGARDRRDTETDIQIIEK